MSYIYPKLIKNETKLQNYEQAMKYRNVLNQIKTYLFSPTFETHENHSFNRSELMIARVEAAIIYVLSGH